MLAVAVGTYLPLQLSTPILFGGLISLAVHRWRRNTMDRQAKATGLRTGLLFAAGLITGEAIVGILLAIPIVMFRGENPLNITGEDGPLPAGIADYLPSPWPGAVLLLLLVVMVMLYRVARGK